MNNNSKSYCSTLFKEWLPSSRTQGLFNLRQVDTHYSLEGLQSSILSSACVWARIIDKVVEQQACKALLHHLGERSVEAEVVDILHRAPPTQGSLLLHPLQKSLVAVVDSIDVALDGEFPVYHWKLRAQVGFVEVVGVFHVDGSQT